MKYVLLFLLTFNSFADVIPVKKGEGVPEDGYFITVDQEKFFRLLNEENKQLKTLNLQLKDLNITLNEENSILKQRITGYEDYNKYLLDRIETSRADGFWNKTFYFISGIVVMGGATYLATKTSR